MVNKQNNLEDVDKFNCFIKTNDGRLNAASRKRLLKNSAGSVTLYEERFGPFDGLLSKKV